MEFEFNAADYLTSEGMQILGVGSKPGTVKIQTPDGQQGEFNPAEYVKAQGLDPTKGSISLNTPDAPVNVSPVEFTDRVKLALGNAKGAVGYLKNKFEDVKFNSQNQLVVKNKGLWQPVDAQGLGDGTGIDMAKEFFGDLGDLTDVAIQTGAGAAALAAAPATAGASVAAAGAAGAASKGIVTSLGRIVGTYGTGDPEQDLKEQLKDSALDLVLSAGGQAVALGATKHVLPKLKSALTEIAQKGSALTKDTIAKTLNVFGGVTEENAVRALTRPQEVGAAFDEVISLVGKNMPEAQVIAQSQESAGKAIFNVLQNPQKKLSAQFMMKQAELVKNAPLSLSADLKPAVEGTFQQLMDLGLMNGVTGPKGDIVAYTAVSPKRISEMLGAAGVDEISAKGIHKSLQAWVNSAQTVVADGPVTGGKAVEAVLNTKRAFDDFYYNLIDGREQVEKVLTPITSRLRTSILNSFQGAPDAVAEVAEGVANLSNFYKDHKPFVSQAQKLLENYQSGTGRPTYEAFVKKMFSDPESHRSAKALVSAMGKLGGNLGEKLADKAFDQVAAADFVRLAPRGSLGMAPRVVVSGAAAGAAGLAAGPGAAIAVGLASSPRNALRASRAVNTLADPLVSGVLKAKNFVLGLPQSSRRELLEGPGLQLLMQEIARQQGDQEQLTQQLIQQATGGQQ